MSRYGLGLLYGHSLRIQHFGRLLGDTIRIRSANFAYPTDSNPGLAVQGIQE